MNTLQELNALGVGFVSLSEALDLTTPSGRALAGMLAVFAEFERDMFRFVRGPLKAGIDPGILIGTVSFPSSAQNKRTCTRLQEVVLAFRLNPPSEQLHVYEFLETARTIGLNRVSEAKFVSVVAPVIVLDPEQVNGGVETSRVEQHDDLPE